MTPLRRLCAALCPNAHTVLLWTHLAAQILLSILRRSGSPLPPADLSLLLQAALTLSALLVAAHLLHTVTQRR